MADNQGDKGKKGEVDKKKDETGKKRKRSKWPKVKKQLKEQGKLKATNYMDFEKIIMPIPRTYPDNGTDVLTETTQCGFFNWTFKLMSRETYNKLRNPNQPKKEGEGDDQGWNVSHLRRQNQRTRFPPRNRRLMLKIYPKRRKQHMRMLKRKRSKRISERAGHILQAECSPTDIFDKEMHSWRLIATFRTHWRESSMDNKLERIENGEETLYGRLEDTRRRFVFHQKESTQVVRWFTTMRVNKNEKANALAIRFWVIKICRVNYAPPLDFADIVGRVCIRAKQENIFVHKGALAIHSLIFRQKIDAGQGLAVTNPILVEERFTPSLIRLAISAILEDKKIRCSDVPELLDFGQTYKIGFLLGIIEESLIYRRKCLHWKMPAKVVLAYKYGLDEYINTFVQNMDTIEEIKSTLAKEYDGGLPEEFKQMLQRKLAMMEKEEAKLRAKRKAKRKEWKQKHHEAEKVKKKKRKEAKEERRKNRPKKEDNKTAEKDEVMKSSSSAAKRNMKKAEDGVKKMKIGP